MNYYEHYSKFISVFELFERLYEDYESLNRDIELEINNKYKVHFSCHIDLDFTIESKSHCIKFSSPKFEYVKSEDVQVQIQFYKNNTKKLNNLKVSGGQSLNSIEFQLLEFKSLEKIFYTEIYREVINSILNELEKTN